MKTVLTLHLNHLVNPTEYLPVDQRHAAEHDEEIGNEDRGVGCSEEMQVMEEIFPRLQ